MRLVLGGTLRSVPRLKLITLIVPQLKTEGGQDEYQSLTSTGSSSFTIVLQTMKPSGACLSKSSWAQADGWRTLEHL